MPESFKIPQWLVYDLHMHSFSSRPDRPERVKEMSATDFVQILSDNKVDVFSVTDHNCFDASFYADLSLAAKAKGMGLIYGSELTVYLPDEGHKHFHMGVYFSSEVKPGLVEKTIEELYRLGDGKNPTLFPTLGAIIQKLFTLKCAFVLIPEAKMLNEVYGKLKNDGKLEEIERHQIDGLQRVFGAYHAGDSFNESGVDNWALSFYQLSEDYRIFSSRFSEAALSNILSEVKRKFKDDSVELGTDAQDLYQIVCKYGKHYSFFHFSDWHNKENYSPHFKNYVFGSLENPFDTLALAIADPLSRIIVRPTSEPKPLILDSFIKEINFKVGDNKESIYFTPGLNAIVGQRASGKSFLLSVIKKLSDRNDPKLDEYSENLDIRPNSITAVDYGGHTLNLGNLADVAFVDQDAISGIYRHPKSLQSALKKYYPDPQKISWLGFDEILKLSRSIQKYDQNYRSLNSYLSFPEIVSSYNFLLIPKIESSTLAGSFDQTISDIQNLVTALKSNGFSADSLKKILASVEEAKNHYLYVTQAMNSLFAEINDQIIKERSALDADQATANQISTLYREGLNVIVSNFDRLLTAKKLVYQLNQFSPRLPDYSLRRHGKFLFASGFQIKGDSLSLKDSLFEKIFEGVSRTKFRGALTPNLFFQFLNGQVLLKANYSSPCSELDESFVTSSVEESDTLYEISDSGLMAADFMSREDLDKLENDRKMENITNSSLGRKSAAYLSIVIDEEKSILVFDQPEDNIDNIYIAETFVPLLKDKKKTRQLIFVTHNPSVAVYTDAFNYVYATNKDGVISYRNLLMEKPADREEIMSVLDGGRPSFFNRNEKYGEVLEEYLHGTKDHRRTN